MLGTPPESPMKGALPEKLFFPSALPRRLGPPHLDAADDSETNAASPTNRRVHSRVWLSPLEHTRSSWGKTDTRRVKLGTENSGSLEQARSVLFAPTYPFFRLFSGCVKILSISPWISGQESTPAPFLATITTSRSDKSLRYWRRNSSRNNRLRRFRTTALPTLALTVIPNLLSPVRPALLKRIKCAV